MTRTAELGWNLETAREYIIISPRPDFIRARIKIHRDLANGTVVSRFVNSRRFDRRWTNKEREVGDDDVARSTDSATIVSNTHQIMTVS